MTPLPPAAPDAHDLLARRQRLLGPAYRLFYDQPLHPVRGEGVWLFDADGRRYLDAYNNVASVGHGHPRVVQAIAAQAARLNTHTRYLHDTVLDCAERLLATLPAEVDQVMFTCTGSEANDLALRIARAATGAQGLIVTRWAYHGVTESTAEASPSLGAGMQLGERVRTVDLPLQAPQRAGEPVPDVATAGAAFASAVQAAIDDLALHGMKPAALLIDGVLSSDGVWTDPAGFLAPAVQAMRAAGGLYIADEVQAGFCRTGDAFWGFARHGSSTEPLVPDIVTMGKPMGNGHPVAAVALRRDVLAPFAARCRYFNTFGGNPVAMAAALAVLEVLQDEGLQARAARLGTDLRASLAELGRRHACAGAVRGAGLFIGFDLVQPQDRHSPAPDIARQVVNRMRELGVLLSATGEAASTLKIRPPLVFEPAHAQQLVQTLDQALAEAMR